MSDAPPASPVPPPVVPSSERVRIAYQRRNESDYIFDFWTALGWTIVTFGIFALYAFYQLMRRMADHNRRRTEVLDAALTFAWEKAGEAGAADELRPVFERIAANMTTLRDMSGNFRDPAVWTVLNVIGGPLTQVIAFYLLDSDLLKHDQAEAAVESDLATVYERLGHPLPAPAATRAKERHNYAGRIVASILSFGIYMLWWWYDMISDGNRHFRADWLWEDAVGGAVYTMSA